jgi:uncharacterized protein
VTAALQFVDQIATELKLSPRQVTAVVELLDGGATVPFIARYRKEVTGGLDEVAIIAIRDRSAQLRELDDRRKAILKSLEEQGVLTDTLRAKVQAAITLAALEDIYLPYRPKRRTRGMMAKEKGLEPLAKLLFEQGPADPSAEALRFTAEGGCATSGVASVEEALAGARDIMAEWINEDAAARSTLRELFARDGLLTSTLIPGKDAVPANLKFRDYFDWSEPIATAPSHRVLAIRRGEKELALTFSIQPPESEAINLLERQFIKPRGGAGCVAQVRLALRDGYKRLMGPSIETDTRVSVKKRADAEAIRVFVENIRELLLSSPLGQKRMLAVDPGFRTGCKIVCLDRQGKLLHHDVIFPLEPVNRVADATAKVRQLVQQYDIEAISIGNGTGGREAETFCRAIDFGPGSRPVVVVMVNESGASVYSASEVAREEFPDQDITVRGAVSIGRRLMDPLAELVKIDPRSIGVGQYQHDVDERALKSSLDDTVASCVNAVGVEVNTASKELLSHVSGLGTKVSANVVAHRNEHGPFASRRQLLKVAGLGPKTFEQAAGFLRIRESENPLDGSAVHPESYAVVEQMAADLGCTVGDLVARADLRAKIDLKKYVTETTGMPTLTDILAELAKPGRDPRKQFELFQFADGVREMKDLQVGMKLPGIVTNVTAFGAFVDIGVHQDGLVHISQLADRFVKDPADVVKVQQRVSVTVMTVDLERKRIGLSMKSDPDLTGQRQQRSGPADRSAGPSAPRPKRPEAAPRHDSNNPFVEFFKNRKP